ncbi:uncharacterized protein LOC120766896 [Bactrocera tryoni]|uniref:uncharacterized protein LOC120766896 n=1 Tax=Bactrocera tryoni TaxID=59916 RepID=UPI001A961CA2|nr:uncharacterized protein LOC120766896 [Bactrocera tryoni]
MSRLIFNENALEELEYRRCTWWSSFLENLAERDDGEVYDVNSLDKEFDDDSSNDDADEAEEVEDLEDIEYHNLMNQSSEQEKTTFIMESEEIQDILNSTRPILKEHELKLKKTGLEKVMNTFDSVRIEKEVGGWMRRQHSLHISKTKIQSTSDTDSSLSCEDDRYVRSVQKCHHMRKPKYKQCFKKCKNYQTSYCTHGIFVEPKPHKLHNCNCCKYQLNSIKTSKYWKMSSTGEPEIIDKQHGKLTVFSENKSKKHHCTQQDSSSSDSDCDFQGGFLKRDMSPVRESQNRFLTMATVEEPLLQKEKRNRLTSMIENVYETPTKSKAVKSNIPNTAPSRITTKRTAAEKALSLLNTNKIRNAKSIKSKSVDKTQKNENSSSEYNTTFENDIKKAKALSLKTLKQNNDKYNSSKSQPCTSSESTNNNLFKLVGSSRNKKVKESASTVKTIKKAERKNKTQSKSIKKQSCLKKFDGKRDEAKENTFLAHSENICNSTALNTAAARKQLPSRVPVVEENFECSPTATPCIENKQHTLRKKTTSHLSPIEESSTSSSEATPKMTTQFKNAFSSTAIPGAATAKELIVLSPPAEEHATPTKETSKIGVRHAVTEPRRKQRRFMKNNKTMDYRSNISNTTLESAVKANRIMLYTPQRKARSMDGDFQVTKELMSSIVGEKHARRFFKYHIGRLTFPKTSTIYYCPPETELSSSESDEDPLQKAGRCGELHESEQQDDSNVV